jgi:hypothetical protein
MLSYIDIGNSLHQFVYQVLPSGEKILSAEFDLTSYNLTDKWGHLLRAGRDILAEVDDVGMEVELDLFLFYLTAYHEEFEDGNKEAQLPTEQELTAYWNGRGFSGFVYPFFD